MHTSFNLSTWDMFLVLFVCFFAQPKMYLVSFVFLRFTQYIEATVERSYHGNADFQRQFHSFDASTIFPSLTHIHTHSLALSRSLERLRLRRYCFHVSQIHLHFFDTYFYLFVLFVHLFNRKTKRTNDRPALVSTILCCCRFVRTRCWSTVLFLAGCLCLFCVQENLDRNARVVFSHNRFLLNRTCVDCWLMSLRMSCVCDFKFPQFITLVRVLERMIRQYWNTLLLLLPLVVLVLFVYLF